MKKMITHRSKPKMAVKKTHCGDKSTKKVGAHATSGPKPKQ